MRAAATLAWDTRTRTSPGPHTRQETDGSGRTRHRYPRFVPTSVDATLAHAEALVADLERDMTWQTPDVGYRGYWKNEDGTKAFSHPGSC